MKISEKLFKNALILISVASIAYTMQFFIRTLIGIGTENVVGPNNFHPWLVVLEAIILLTAAGIPLASVFRPDILELKFVKWTAAICLAYGIAISINFFVQTGVSASVAHLRVGLRLISWCALAYFLKSEIDQKKALSC